CPASVKLFIEQADSTLHMTALGMYENACAARQRLPGIFPWLGDNDNLPCAQLGVKFSTRRVSVVTKQEPVERGAQQSVKPLNIMTIPRHLGDASHHAMRRKDQVFTHAAEPARCACAVANLSQPFQPHIFDLRSFGPAN